MQKHLDITVCGKVVDVDFRLYAKQAAESLGVSGFAKNAGADRVYVEAEGEGAALEKFLDFCRRGSPWSEVKSVDVSEGLMKNFSGFERV